ncbi:hypothetical protein HPB50_018819 [Hyalomma asiaticum]|uniref:Uncharacterized protein n=1 Tax=Hyalomma asiaticum TaxID=266040 RepID=A0ACB7TKB5_HYAAI|nr:hypothetical protein HPB50_018819 [Hyalomma asiaticum]
MGKTLPIKSAFSLCMRVIDVLEYVHSYDYINVGVKSSVLLLGFSKCSKNKVYLVDFALACRYTQNGKHKEYKEDLRKAQDGTIEFTSRDAHIGANSRCRDMEIVAYNMLQWLCCPLPWADNLTNPKYISHLKSSLKENIHLVTGKGFPHGVIPCVITEFLQYVASVKFEDTPDYKRLKRILEKGIRAAGFNGRLPFTPPRTPRRHSFSPKKPALNEIILAENSTRESGDESAVRKPSPANVSRSGHAALVRKKNRRSPATTKSAFGLGGLVKLQPQRKRLGRARITPARMASARATTAWAWTNPLRQCWKCLKCWKEALWRNSRKVCYFQVEMGESVPATRPLRTAARHISGEMVTSFLCRLLCYLFPVQTEKAMHPLRRNTT